jgi:hypothetical protein
MKIPLVPPNGATTVGFTGTRQGLTQAQHVALVDVLYGLQPGELHHGDCLGADYAVHLEAIRLGVPEIVIHPPSEVKWRAFCKADDNHPQVHIRLLLPQGYLARNREILMMSDVLVAAPKTVEAPANLRGEGTWTTIKYATEMEMPRIIVYPTGAVKKEL